MKGNVMNNIEEKDEAQKQEDPFLVLGFLKWLYQPWFPWATQ